MSLPLAHLKPFTKTDTKVDRPICIVDMVKYSDKGCADRDKMTDESKDLSDWVIYYECTEPKADVFFKTEQLNNASSSKIYYTDCENDRIVYQHCGNDNKPMGDVVNITSGTCYDFEDYSIKVEVSRSKIGTQVAIVLLLIAGSCCCCLGTCFCCYVAFSDNKEEEKKDDEKKDDENPEASAAPPTSEPTGNISQKKLLDTTDPNAQI